MLGNIVLFTMGIFIKIFIFHFFMEIPRNLLLITFNNLLVILAIYCLAGLVKEGRRLKVFLLANIILSLLIFVDAMYYSHFFTLIPIHSIYQVGQLGPVSNSIFTLLKPGYLLVFIDTIFLWIYYKKQHRTIPILERKHKLVLAGAFFVFVFSVAGGVYKVGRDTEGNYTPHNLGIINYHLYDIGRFFVKSSLDIDRVEAVMDIVNYETDNPRGFGLVKNRNVIVIQAESTQNFVINQEIEGQMITPVLNQLINKDSIYFSRYYEQVGWGNTSDAEFVSHNGFYPSTGTFSYKAFEENDFINLPILLKERGYSTIAFHGNHGSFWNRDNIYNAQGFDTFISLEKLEEDELIGIGLSDASLFRQSIKHLKNLKQPFYSFYVTLTSHHPFTMEDHDKGLTIEGEYSGTLLEDYLQTVHYLDQQIGNFIEMLKQEGLYDNSIIVIYGDHEGLDMRNEEANDLLSSFLAKPYEEDEMFRVPMIVHIPNSGVKEEVTIAGGQIDFFPTMANLLGLSIKTDQVLGKDLLNIKEGFVAKQVHIAKGSFIDNDKVFIISSDGVFENSRAWNIYTGEAVDLEECREGYERALGEINLSEYILENNLVSVVKEKGLEYILSIIYKR
ncbi:LTA synthase family protein [Natronincola ferrireducens]|uniref:Phosphoglycerol transferase MdoB n=1 Tax=Natronincola ferrireducens TaxID=393762 RepID=A0A1G8ZZU9_9FIRM|nr:LTA synthase family protein [Natronincola ferrireducens]SDK20652.1 Phosphoglycerol transferase MdoB [Natronincola ferrireducens]